MENGQLAYPSLFARCVFFSKEEEIIVWRFDRDSEIFEDGFMLEFNRMRDKSMYVTKENKFGKTFSIVKLSQLIDSNISKDEKVMVEKQFKDDKLTLEDVLDFIKEKLKLKQIEKLMEFGGFKTLMDFIDHYGAVNLKAILFLDKEKPGEVVVRVILATSK